MRVLLRDVAQAAGCTPSTASRALRGDLRISAATRGRVATHASRLGYRPDPLLSALATYRSRGRALQTANRLAFISTWPAAISATIVSDALRTRCAALGYQLEVIRLDGDRAKHRATGARLRDQGVRGLILGTGAVQQDELDLPWEHFACISVSGAPAMRLFPSVTSNYATNVRQVLERLHAAGYRRPGLLLDEWIMRVTREACLTGWGHAFTPDGRAPSAPLILTARPDPGHLRAWVTAERLDAVISFSTYHATLLEGSGVRIPNDVGFACLDARKQGLQAGIVQPREACQEIAVDLLTTRLGHNELGPLLRPYAIQLDGLWMDGPSLPLRRRARSASDR